MIATTGLVLPIVFTSSLPILPGAGIVSKRKRAESAKTQPAHSSFPWPTDQDRPGIFHPLNCKPRVFSGNLSF